ncbi:MAG: hypothetical protein ACOYK6_00080 [Chthoniobacterales bacterium]
MNQETGNNRQLITENRELSQQSNVPGLWNDEVIAAWIERAPAASSIDQWIYWNSSPLRHASHEVLATFFPASFKAILIRDSLVTTHVDSLLRSRLSWNATVNWAPQDPLWEVSMISPDRFQRLVLLSASFSMKSEISRIIDGSMVRKLRAQLGEDIFQFVLLSNASLKYFLEPLHDALSAFSDITEAIYQGSVMIVQQAFSSKERGVQERIATKFSGCFAQGYYETPLPWNARAEEILSGLWKEAGSWM